MAKNRNRDKEEQRRQKHQVEEMKTRDETKQVLGETKRTSLSAQEKENDR